MTAHRHVRELVENSYPDAEIDLILLADSDQTAYSLSTCTRMVLRTTGGVVDSDENPVAFDWGDGGDGADDVAGKVVLRLGDAGLPAAEYTEAQLVVYDAQYPTGKPWPRNLFQLVVQDPVEVDG